MLYFSLVASLLAVIFVGILGGCAIYLWLLPIFFGGVKTAAFIYALTILGTIANACIFFFYMKANGYANLFFSLIVGGGSGMAIFIISMVVILNRRGG